jgi:hypothetical protein
MKVLSVRQPFASLICAGIKTIENRSWKTDYRGTILIHASKDEKINEFDLPLPVHQEYLRNIDKDGVIKENAVFRMLEIDEDGDLKLTAECWKNEEIRKEFQFLKAILSERYYEPEKDFYPLHSIIGRVDLVDIQQNNNSVWSDPDSFNWILEEPDFFCDPIQPVKGKLKLWNHEDKPEKMCYDFGKVE